MVWCLLHPPQSGKDFPLHLIRAGDDLAPKGVILQVVPDQLVGVQFRGVRGQKEQAQSGADGFDKCSDHHRLMRRMTVDNQKDRAFPVENQALQVLDENLRRHAPLDNRKVKLAPPAHGGYQVHAEARSRRRNDGRLAFRSPRFPAVRVRTHTGLIPKEDVRPANLRFAANLRVLLLQPVRHGFRILLVGAPQGALSAQAKLIHQPTDGRTAQLDAELPPNHDPHQVQRPQCKGELHLQWVLSNNGFVNPFHVLRGQFPRPPATLAGAQAIPPAIAVHREPTENGRPADPKRLSHFVRRVPVLHAGDSAPTQLGQRLVRQGPCVLLHAENDSTTSILCPYYFGKISNAQTRNRFPCRRISYAHNRDMKGHKRTRLSSDHI